MKNVLMRRAVGLLVAFTTIGTAAGSAASDDPLAAYRWKSRVLVIAAPSASDASYKAQRVALASQRGGLAERDLVTIEALGHSAEAGTIRRHFGLREGAFRAMLVGKDGGVKLSSDKPITPEELFATIDAMPMRREEMRRR